MLSEFEEKQYEQHLNIELLQGSNLIFPPGQHLESKLGFDAALFTKNRDFWRHFVAVGPWYRRIFRYYANGTDLHEHVTEIVGEKSLEDAINQFPQFKFNAFIQHKRPERMIKDTAAEWHSWNQEYYRYKLLDHQQSILEHLERSVRNEGIVTYASPAFHTNKEFWEVLKSQSFIRNSNFCQPSKLIGHKTYSYIEGGTNGIAHSEPEIIESKNLVLELERLSQDEPKKKTTNTQFISNTCNIIEEALKSQEKHYALYSEIINDLDKQKTETPTTLRNLYKLSVFNFVTGINLYFVINRRSSRLARARSKKFSQSPYI